MELTKDIQLIKGDIIFNPLKNANYRVDKSTYNVHSDTFVVSMTPIAPFSDKMFSFTTSLEDMMQLGYKYYRF